MINLSVLILNFLSGCENIIEFRSRMSYKLLTEQELDEYYEKRQEEKEKSKILYSIKGSQVANKPEILQKEAKEREDPPNPDSSSS